MAQAIQHSSPQRQALAQRVAAALYGVIAIMTAELAVEPGQLSYSEAVFGALAYKRFHAAAAGVRDDRTHLYRGVEPVAYL